MNRIKCSRTIDLYKLKAVGELRETSHNFWKGIKNQTDQKTGRICICYNNCIYQYHKRFMFRMKKLVLKTLEI